MRDYKPHSNVLRLNSVAPICRIAIADPKSGAPKNIATTPAASFDSQPQQASSSSASSSPSTMAISAPTSAAAAAAGSYYQQRQSASSSSLLSAALQHRQLTTGAPEFACNRNNNNNNISQNNADANNEAVDVEDDQDDDDDDDDDDEVDDDAMALADDNGHGGPVSAAAGSAGNGQGTGDRNDYNGAANGCSKSGGAGGVGGGGGGGGCRESTFGSPLNGGCQQAQQASYGMDPMYGEQQHQRHSHYHQQQQQQQQVSHQHQQHQQHQQQHNQPKFTTMSKQQQQQQQQQPGAMPFRRISSATMVGVGGAGGGGHQPKNYALWFVTPVVASFAVAIVVASLAGPQWMLTTERQPNPAYNGTANANRPDDGMYVIKYTKSSLWILCTSPRFGSTASGLTETTCTTIDYFPQEEYSPDPNDSTMAIPYAITRSTPFFLLSGISLLISYMVLIIAMCAPHQHHVYFFTSGVLFIISGLIMLIGLIMYISIFKAEIGSKLRPKSPLQPPLFTFEYGQSFCLYVLGFLLTEAVGVLNVFLFIGLQQMRVTLAKVGLGGAGTRDADGMDSAAGVPCFLGAVSLPDKVKELNCSAGAMAKNGEGTISPEDGFYSPVTDRRYFFEKQRGCDVHQTGANNAPDNRFVTSPPPSLPLQQFQHTRRPSASNSMRSASQQFPLTRSVSTATELFDAQDRHRPNAAQPFEQLQNDHNGKMAAFSTSRNFSQSTHHLPKAGGSVNSILSSSVHYGNRAGPTATTKSKDEMFREFCDRAGRRYNPKEIYFIDMSDEEQVQQAYGQQYRQQQQPQQQSQNFNLYASNSSLHKSYPKSLFELEQRGLRGIQNNIRAKQNGGAEEAFGGSRQSWRTSGEQFSSQTLPRNFLKHNAGECGGAGGAAAGYSEGGRQPTSRYAQGRYEVRSSHDNLLQSHQSQRQQQQHQAWAAGRPGRMTGSRDDIVNWPNAIPASPSSFSTRSQFYSRQHQQQQHQQQHQHQHHRYGTVDGRDYQRSPLADGGGDTFDLDRMENERRKSHASLFEAALDFENGTAV